MGSEEYTDPDNKWLNDAPGKSDGKDFLTAAISGGGAGGSQGIDVKPDGVKQFASRIAGEAKDVMGNFADGVMPMASQTGKMGASFVEAAYLTGQVAQGNERLAKFQADASMGLLSLGRGAFAIAINYLNGDTTSAATMTDVQKAFDVAGGRGYNNAPTTDSAPPPTGQQAPSSLPEAQKVVPTPRDPNAPQPIKLGDRDSYSVPAAAPDDLERRGIPEDSGKLAGKYGDDLKDQGWKQGDDGGWTPPND